MADPGGRSEAGAATPKSAVFSQSRRPQHRKSRKKCICNSTPYFWHVTTITSYLAVLMLLSVRPCWDVTTPASGNANFPTKHVCSQLHLSGQYGTYHDVLNNGRAHSVPQRKDSLKGRNNNGRRAYRKLLSYLLTTTLLLSGDVQLNPGPNNATQTELTRVEAAGNVRSVGELGGCQDPVLSAVLLPWQYTNTRLPR